MIVMWLTLVGMVHFYYKMLFCGLYQTFLTSGEQDLSTGSLCNTQSFIILWFVTECTFMQLLSSHLNYKMSGP